MKKLVALLAVLALAGIANAGVVVYDGAFFTVTATDMGAVGDNENLVATLLTLTNKSGGSANTIGGTISASGNGVHHEVLDDYTTVCPTEVNWTNSPVSFSPVALAKAAASTVDSYWLTMGYETGGAGAPAETMFAMSTCSPDYATTTKTTFPPATKNHVTVFGALGNGTTWALLGYAGSSWDFAYVVAQAGETVTHVGTLAGGGVEEDVNYDFTVPVPEPASMALLGFGGLGVLLRRRR